MNKLNRNKTGFTLIEVMIVVAIIAVIAVIGVPMYSEQMKKARRSDAQQLLMDVANRQQQYFLDVRQYTTDFTALNISKDGWTCGAANCSNNFYTVTIAADNAATPPTFTITAAATGTQASDGNLTLNNLGAKTHGGQSGW